jgi:hypothetical protein
LYALSDLTRNCPLALNAIGFILELSVICTAVNFGTWLRRRSTRFVTLPALWKMLIVGLLGFAVAVLPIHSADFADAMVNTLGFLVVFINIVSIRGRFSHDK